MPITILDGGMGQELVARSGKTATPLWATSVMMDNPEIVEAVHQDYFQSGADVATVNSYAIHRDRLVPYDIEDQFAALHQRACEIACRARDTFGNGTIAGSMGPTGRSYRPDLSLEVEQSAELYAEIARLQAPFVDLYLLETMASFAQAKGAAMGAKSVGKPVWVSINVDDDNGSVLRSGEPIDQVYGELKSIGVNAILLNCSIPEAVTRGIQEMGELPIPIGAYANGFTKISKEFLHDDGPTVNSLETRTDLDPNSYLEFAQQWQSDGATIIGGCCEVGPAHIKKLASHFKS